MYIVQVHFKVQIYKMVQVFCINKVGSRSDLAKQLRILSDPDPHY